MPVPAEFRAMQPHDPLVPSILMKGRRRRERRHNNFQAEDVTSLSIKAATFRLI
jgi:hypothetical protein